MKPLHHKTHTIAKRGLSLLCVLALCLGLLPVTALAAGEDVPNVLYVGTTNIGTTSYNDNAAYWTSADGGTTWTSQLNQPEGDSYIYYNGQGTLELHNVTIQGTFNESNPSGAGIYALCGSNQSVSLTIQLTGNNTITGNYGIYVEAQQGGTLGANASLSITGDGSLTVTGTASYGLYVKSGTGNASLTIESASVDATSSVSYFSYAGVCVQSSSDATSSPKLSLTVNGGSLTTSASEGNDGIQFYVGAYEATSATTSLTVTDNAIVDARTGGISASGVSVNPNVTIGSTGSTGGIVWNGAEGTVYGDVTLNKSLTINEGENLTIPDGSTLNANGNLTNNGTIVNKGTMNGDPTGGTGKIETTPTIDIQPASQSVTEGEDATFTVAASGENLSYQWQKITDNDQGWTDIEGAISATYTIAATSTSMSGTQYQCVVSNSAGSVTSNAATLTVNSVPVTGVTLDETELALYTGGSATLTAKVAPDDATNQAVTWSSDNTNVATVESGNVTAVGAGTATITVTTEDGQKTAACTVTVTDKTYTISADTTALDFGSAYTGYAQPAAQTVIVENTGNQPVTLNQPASTSSFEVGTLSKTTLAAGETAIFTVQPQAGLAAGTYSETIEVVSTEGTTVTIPASFTVKSRPSYNPPTVSEETTDAIKAADPGETVTVDLSSGSTKLDKEVFETLAGRDVTLVIDLGDGVSWTVKGSDIPENADFIDIDMGVTMNSDGIPVDVVDAITGERDSVQITLAHDGVFGFTMTLTAPLGAENAGLWANLYHFNESANKMTFETAAKINSDGSVSLALNHASQYAIVIDDHNHGVVTLPFTDVSEGDWFYDPVCYVYRQGLMTGTSATTFEPNTSLSRAMLVAVLHRLEGSPQASAGDFSDVADGDWYAQAVNWAASVGVVNGFDDGTFQPNTAITREQLAAILRNYNAYKGMDVTASGSLANYSDAASISDWAKESVTWAVGENLISGVTDDTLAPQACATRAQVAAILQRYLSE